MRTVELLDSIEQVSLLPKALRTEIETVKNQLLVEIKKEIKSMEYSAKFLHGNAYLANHMAYLKLKGWFDGNNKT